MFHMLLVEKNDIKRHIIIVVLTCMWVVPIVYAISRITNYYPFGITMRCLYFSLGVLGTLITNFLVK